MPAHKPQEIHTLFLVAFNRGDIEALVALYEPNAILVTGSGNAAGHDAIRAAYQRILAGGSRMELQTRAVIESGNGLALLHANWTIHRDGKAIPGLSTEVVRQQSDGAWMFLIDEPRTPETQGSL
jgi:uncharacterized protein (TIGR02246 family)